MNAYMKKVPLTPLGEKVLITPIAVEEKTASGIYRPDAGEQKSQTGKIVAIGDSEEITLKNGQTVLYKKYAGDEVAYEDVEYVVVNHDEVLAVIEDK